MKQRSTLILPLMAALAIPGLAAASGAGNHAHGASVQQAAGKYTGHAAALGEPGSLKEAKQTIEIDMADTMRFKPEKIEIKQGETVRFVVKNSGMLKHEMVLGTLAEMKEHAKVMAKFPNMEHADPNAVSVDPGKTGEFAWKFTRTGTFDFACLLPGHFESGMKGRISVKKQKELTKITKM